MQAGSLAKKPIGIVKSSTISDVIKKLLEHRISRLVVLDSGRPIGIISEKDVGLFLFGNSAKSGLDKIPLESLVNKIEYVDQNHSVEECAKIMTDKKISSLCTLGESGAKIFTKTDLVRYFSENYSGRHKVADYMTHNYVSTHNATPLHKVIRKMLESKVSRVITKNQAEQPDGIVSFRDLFRISLDLGDETDDEGFALSDRVRRGFLSENGFGGVSLAKDVMSAGIVTARFDEDLSTACRKMIDNRISSLGVLDGNGGFAGIISKTDVTRALLG